MKNNHITSGPSPYTDVWVYTSITALVGLCWWVVQALQLRSSSNEGYWLGVVGGSLALLLFAYPVRKRLRPASVLGPTKWWFWVHMVLGVLTPAVILVHSTFKVGSLNAGVALYSMLIVAGSGVVGRFLYTRTHRGLQAERQEAAFLYGQVQQRLQALDNTTLQTHLQGLIDSVDAATIPAHANIWLHIQSFLTTSRRHTKAWLQLNTSTRGLPPSERKALLKLARVYLAAKFRVQQFSSATRLFALWHLLHVPFVYIMVICAIAHVVAVHVY